MNTNGNNKPINSPAKRIIEILVQLVLFLKGLSIILAFGAVTAKDICVFPLLEVINK